MTFDKIVGQAERGAKRVSPWFCELLVSRGISCSSSLDVGKSPAFPSIFPVSIFSKMSPMRSSLQLEVSMLLIPIPPPDHNRVDQGVVGGRHRADGEWEFSFLDELLVPATGMGIEYLILVENRDEIQSSFLI